LSILLPTVGGVGKTVDNDRCWRIEWAMGNSWLMAGVIAAGGSYSTRLTCPAGGVFPASQFDVPPIVLAPLRRQSWVHIEEHGQFRPQASRTEAMVTKTT
jgi:hypothetical protein